MANRPNAPEPKTAPTGLRREYAALHCGVSPGHFDKMVKDGILPRARGIGGVKIWLREELDVALTDLPVCGDEAFASTNEASGNTCDAIFPK